MTIKFCLSLLGHFGVSVLHEQATVLAFQVNQQMPRDSVRVRENYQREKRVKDDLYCQEMPLHLLGHDLKDYDED